MAKSAVALSRGDFTVKYTLMAALFAAVAAVSSGSAFANGNAVAGKAKAALCEGCHGATGLSNDDIFPNLAGQRYGYLVKQLEAFRDGARKGPLMNPIAGPLSDQDIKNLAAYFSSLTVEPCTSK
jgi:cytochrome c553